MHWLNKKFILFLLTLSTFRIISFADTEPLYLNISLEQESYLVIHGESNINSFQCNYNNLLADTLNVNAYWQDECLVFQEATINLDTRSFDCGNRQMNEDLQELLVSDEFPYISIDIVCVDVSRTQGRSIIQVHNSPENISIIADITIAGHKQQQRIPVKIDKSENERNYAGSILLDLKEFNIDPPTKMLGLIKVNEIIEVHFYIKVSILESGRIEN